MKATHLIILSALLLAVMACTRHSEVSDTLARAEAVMEEHPDSALYILEEIPDSTLVTSRDSALYALLLTQALDKNYIDVTSDSLINIAVNYFQDHGSKEHLMKALFYKGIIAFNNREYQNAIISSLKANECAKLLNNDLWQARIAELMSDIYSNSYNYIEAISCSTQATEHYLKAGKMLNYRYALCDLGSLYINEGNIEKGTLLIDSVKRMALSEPVDSSLLNYVIESQIVKTLKSDKSNVSATLYEFSKFSNDDSLSEADYLKRILLEIKNGDFDNVKSVINNLQPEGLQLTDKALVFLVYANYYDCIGDYKKSRIYTDSIMSLQTQEVRNVLKQSVMSSQINYYNNLVLLAKKEHRQSIFNFCLVCVGLILIIIIIFLFYHYRLKIKDLMICEKIENILSLTNQIKCQENENRTLNTNLNEKELKIADLSGKIESQKNEIDALCNKITAHESTSDIKIEHLFKEQWITLNMLCNEYFEKGASEKTRLSIIKDIEDEISNLSTPKRLKKIEDNVNKYMNDVVNILKQECSFLKSDDLTFIILVYAGFSPRAVSLITNIKLKYYYTKKERLIKKIQNSSSPNKQVFIDKLV